MAIRTTGPGGVSTVTGQTGPSSASRLEFTVTGPLTTGVGTVPFPLDAALTLVSVRMAVGTASSGAAIIADVNVDGTTIFTTQANRPQIAIGQTVSSIATPDVTSVSAGSVITVDIDQVGSGTAGTNLVLVIRYREA